MEITGKEMADKGNGQYKIVKDGKWQVGNSRAT